MTHPPGEPPESRPRPWLRFLTPAAVFLGAAVIAAAIIVTDDDPPPAPALVAPAAAEAEAVPMTPAPPATATAAAERVPATLIEALDGYAVAIALDPVRFRECLEAPSTQDAVNDHIERGLALGVNATPTFFVNNKRIVGALPAAIFAEVIDAELAGSPDAIEGYSEAIQELAAASPPRFAIMPARPDLANAPIEGDPAAAVIVVEYSDFQCPFCRRWYSDTLPAIRERTGEDVAIAFLHFPIPQLHPNAAGAHFAAECAARQGKFWEMHDLLFERQREWSALPY